VSASSNSRRRLHALGKALRQFGLVDEFGLTETITAQKLPTEAGIERLLKGGRILLPKSVPSKLLAKCIHATLCNADKADSLEPDINLKNVRQKLIKIKTGRPHAAHFHNLSMKLLASIFDQRLGELQKEKNLLQGIKRLDIKANNDQPEGFFANLRKHHSLHCPYIFCECKNYSEDPANPEFDQLLGRLNKTSTMVGLLICRSVKGEAQVLNRCREPFAREGKLVIVLADGDMIHLSELRKQNDLLAIDKYLENKLEKVTL
jgi:hypothetical protein